MSTESIAQLLEHPAIWRGRNAARVEMLPTGFPALDAALPGGGWPHTGLIELLVPWLGIGELELLIPTLARSTQKIGARWCAWIAPPFEPYAPALAAQGLALQRMLIVRAREPLWALEQALGLGACDVVLAWVKHADPRDIRRLQLAAERGRALGVLFRGHGAAREASAAVLRMHLEPGSQQESYGLSIKLLKSRGGRREPFQLSWSESRVCGSV